MLRRMNKGVRAEASLEGFLGIECKSQQAKSSNIYMQGVCFIMFGAPGIRRDKSTHKLYNIGASYKIPGRLTIII